MKNFFIILSFLLLSLSSMATTYTYGVHSGSANITGTSPFTLANGDNVVITGNFSDVTISNVNLVNVTFNMTGATLTHLKSSSLDQVQWNNLSGVTFLGLSITNEWYGEIFLGPFFHDNKFLNCHFVNTTTFSDEVIFDFDWPYTSDMVFTGSKSQTYYNDSLVGCKFGGFINTEIITMSTNWNTGTSPAEINRSLALDMYLSKDTFSVDNTTGNTVSALSGTGFNMKIDSCIFDAISGLTSGHGSHNEAVLWYGSIQVTNSFQNNSYASLLRCYPTAWSGLAGYRTGVFCKAYNNLIKHQLSYSAFEFNAGIGGNRNNSNGFWDCRSEAIHNTVDSTTGLSYNGPTRYEGKVVDFVVIDTGVVEGNVIFRAEQDYASVPYNTDSASHNGYFYSEIGAPVTHLTARNNFSARNSTGYVVDSINYKPSAGSPIIGSVTSYSYYTQDHFGVLITTEKGWAAYTSPSIIYSRQMIIKRKTIRIH